MGRYWKGSDDARLRDQWVTLVANLSTPLSGSDPSSTFLSLTPGYRTRLVGKWFLLAGIEIPLTRHNPFTAQPIFLLLKDF